jgi:hypothetical protein
MINPCLKCVVEIVCKEICPDREDYIEFHRKELEKYHNSSKLDNTPDFDKKYFSAYVKMEEINLENKRFRNISTLISGGSSSSSSSSYKIWKRGTYKEFHDSTVPPKKKTDYLKLNRK